MSNKRAFATVFADTAACGNGWHSRAAAQAASRKVMRPMADTKALAALVREGVLRERTVGNARRYARAGWGAAPAPSPPLPPHTWRSGALPPSRRSRRSSRAPRRRDSARGWRQCSTPRAHCPAGRALQHAAAHASRGRGSAGVLAPPAALHPLRGVCSAHAPTSRQRCSPPRRASCSRGEGVALWGPAVHVGAGSARGEWRCVFFFTAHLPGEHGYDADTQVLPWSAALDLYGSAALAKQTALAYGACEQWRNFSGAVAQEVELRCDVVQEYATRREIRDKNVLIQVNRNYICSDYCRMGMNTTLSSSRW